MSTGNEIVASDLRVWVDDSGSNWVVAVDEDDAWECWTEHYGEKRLDFESESGWRTVDPSDRISICCDEDGDICGVGDGDPVERTAAAWAAKRGRGFLCSVEY